MLMFNNIPKSMKNNVYSIKNKIKKKNTENNLMKIIIIIMNSNKLKILVKTMNLMLILVLQ